MVGGLMTLFGVGIILGDGTTLIGHGELLIGVGTTGIGQILRL
jgi:hypothetical protein